METAGSLVKSKQPNESRDSRLYSRPSCSNGTRIVQARFLSVLSLTPFSVFPGSKRLHRGSPELDVESTSSQMQQVPKITLANHAPLSRQTWARCPDAARQQQLRQQQQQLAARATGGRARGLGGAPTATTPRGVATHAHVVCRRSQQYQSAGHARTHQPPCANCTGLGDPGPVGGE